MLSARNGELGGGFRWTQGGVEAAGSPGRVQKRKYLASVMVVAGILIFHQGARQQGGLE